MKIHQRRNSLIIVKMKNKSTYKKVEVCHDLAIKLPMCWSKRGTIRNSPKRDRFPITSFRKHGVPPPGLYIVRSDRTVFRILQTEED